MANRALDEHTGETHLLMKCNPLEKEIPDWDKEILFWDFPIVTMGRDGQLYAFVPGNQDAPDQLVRIRID